MDRVLHNRFQKLSFVLEPWTAPSPPPSFGFSPTDQHLGSDGLHCMHTLALGKLHSQTDFGTAAHMGMHTNLESAQNADLEDL